VLRAGKKRNSSSVEEMPNTTVFYKQGGKNRGMMKYRKGKY
jgi:hypothetical protein